MTGTFLDQQEVISLTNKVRRPSQAKVLNAMGIDHKVRPDGSVAVLRAHITRVFGGGTESVKTVKNKGPSWSAI